MEPRTSQPTNQPNLLEVLKKQSRNRYNKCVSAGFAELS